MGVSPGNEGLVFLLGNNAINAADPHLRTYFALQRHHPDRQRWLEVGRFATKQIAQITSKRSLPMGMVTSKRFG